MEGQMPPFLFRCVCYLMPENSRPENVFRHSRLKIPRPSKLLWIAEGKEAR